MIISSAISEFVNKVKLGFIATVCPDGTPNLSPKGTVIAWDSDHLAFADIHSPATVTNLKLNASIEINVVDVFSRKGYGSRAQRRSLQRASYSMRSFHITAPQDPNIQLIIS